MNKTALKDRFRIVLAPALLLAATIGLCGPFQMYLTNASELWFSFGDIAPFCVLVGSLLFAALVVIGVLLPEKAAQVYACVLVGISLGLYIQGNFVSTDYGVLDGRAIDWSSYSGVAVTNLLLWLCCLGCPLALFLWRPAAAKKVLVIAAVCLVALQFLSVGILLATSPRSQSDEGNKLLSTDGLDLASADENVVMFILDTFDQDFLNAIYQNEPDFLAPLDGFTCFTNTTCMYPTTKGSLPYILTGKINRNEESYAEYVSHAFQETDYYRELKQQGYTIGLYTLPQFVSDVNDPPMFCNYDSSGAVISSHAGLAGTLYKFTAFRYAPHLLKSVFWFYSGEFDQWRSSSTEGTEAFSMDNVVYYHYLKDKGLRFEGTGKSYKVIHIEGTHLPYTLDENLETAEETATSNSEAKASLRIVYEYIAQLKAAGVYDDTLFIITADHGSIVGAPTNPILLVKPFDSHGELQTSNAPVSHSDLHATVMEELGLNADEKYGRSVFRIPQNDRRIRQYYYYTWDNKWDALYLPKLTEYYVLPEGNSWDCFVPLITDPPEYSLGTRLTFSDEATAKKYSYLGLSINEPTHTWSRSSRAILSFTLDHIPENNVLVHFDVLNIFNGSQKVIVQVADQIIFQKTVTALGTLDFIIPRECIDSQILTIHLEFPDAVSSASLGISDDSSLLALCFTGMYLEETDLTQEQLESQRILYELGQTILFTEDSDGRRFFSKGMSAIEKDFVWSSGKTGEINLYIGNDFTGPLTALFQFKKVFNGSQRLTVRSEGETLYDEIVTEENMSVSFEIPSSCIRDGYLTLELSYPDAVSPVELGLGNDDRALAFAYHFIELAESERE